MRASLLGGLIVVGIALAAGKTAAHHPFAADFDRTKPITLTGTVTKVERSQARFSAAAERAVMKMTMLARLGSHLSVVIDP
jgi:cephalosporin-C deacetylase-like acetyl esterase